MPRSRTAARAALLLALLPLATCKAPTEPEDALALATFEARVDGAVTDTLSGEAHASGEATGGPLQVWTVDLDDAGGGDQILLVTGSPRVPEAGSAFTVRSPLGAVPDEADGARIVYTRRVGGALRTYHAYVGSVLVLEGGEGRTWARGRFEGVLADASGDTVTVHGRFHAAEDAGRVEDLADGG